MSHAFPTTTQGVSKLELTLLAQEFLATEAKLLDERRFWEWYALLDDAIVYHIPLRQARLEFKDEFPTGAYRILDHKKHIETRIKRIDSGAAWAETPPSRTLRMVGSLLVETTEHSDILVAESALMLYRQRGHDDKGDLIAARRRDQLRLTANGLRLLRRDALIAEAVLTTPNLGVFI
ncbi:MAG: aromatic-ring-hydroxylating dioxygenase subunit beta [Giesbergeria sp.]|uniref:aromatic-ring-hydroxylating dioxygenase subunit beta n=1 Tax=Giesbergeria sp. TaxID=2818473 RepID=UPI002616A480|nr:aromatic-ring-hydroxylating dioxygenase subunit beta [Giesbergeria sp.]MDD2610231.1 aromatic-ring-hydroxylating dioxygenase subunit beta [Giesbergeria sp.]